MQAVSITRSDSGMDGKDKCCCKNKYRDKMLKIVRGNDFTLNLALTRQSGVGRYDSYDLTGWTPSVKIINSKTKEETIVTFTVSDNIISVPVDGELLEVGTYDIEVVMVNGEQDARSYACKQFAIVETNAEAYLPRWVEFGDYDASIIHMPMLVQVGLSAYEIALKHGFSGSEEEWLASLKGETGAAGPANTLSIGTVVSGTTAAASISGTAPNQRLNLVLPQGPAGQDGQDGAAATIEIGTVTTGAAGTSASVENVGTSSAARLNFVIPQGAQGANGTDGVGIASVTQTTTSTESGGTNVITVTKTDGTEYNFNIKNGSRGKSAYQVAVDNGYEGTEEEFVSILEQTADEEDITVNASNRYQLKDRIYNAQQPNGMGYVILRKNKTFAEQVIVPYTIYEVRYDFNLNEDEIVVPTGCRFVFNGGKITNGTIVSNDHTLQVENIPGSTLLEGVFSEGYNYNGQTVCAENIGMIPRVQGMASVNDAILGVVTSLQKNLVVDDYYFISTSAEVNYDFSITGKGTIDRGEYSAIFIPKENSSLYVEGITFVNGYVVLVQALTYNFSSIHFKDCVFKGMTRIVDIRNNSNDSHNISEVIVEGCYCDTQSSGLVLTPKVDVDNFVIKNNIIDHFVGTFVWYSNVNDDNSLYGNVIIERNIVNGPIIFDNPDYFTFALVACDKFIYRNNTIRGLIGVGSGYTYDAYGSSREYICEGNYFENICQMPKTGSLNATLSEIFKSKGHGGIRCGRGNVWNIDFNKVREILAENNITFTDEQFEGINYLGFFDFTSVVDVDFFGNRISIANGGLFGSPSSRPIRNLVFRGNHIMVGKVSLYPCIALSRLNGVISNFVIENNTFAGNNNWFNTASPPSYSNIPGQIILRGNVFDRPFYPPYAENGEIRDNILNNHYNIGRFTNVCKITGCEIFAQNDTNDASKPTILTSINRRAKASCWITSVKHFILLDDGVYVSVDGKFTFKIDKTNRQILDVFGNVIKSNVSIQYWAQSAIYNTEKYIIYLSVGASIVLGISPVTGNVNFPVSLELFTDNPLSLNDSSRVSYFDNQMNEALFYDGTDFKDADGFPPALKKGDTASRPVASVVGAGFTYFDTDLGKMIVSNGTDWVNMDGTALS